MENPFFSLGEDIVDQQIERAFDRFSKTLSKIDHSDLSSIKSDIFSQIDRIAELIEHSDKPEEAREDFFNRCGLFDYSVMHKRTRWKPMGYAGDFLVIDWIYTQKTAESGLGKKIDELFHSYEAAQAVRNRKAFFIKTCAELTKTKKTRIDVLDLGCGSCRDVLEAHQRCNNGVQYFFHCVDHEPEAIEYAKSLLHGTEAEPYIQLDCRNVFKFDTAKRYDLIWSAGLFDYLSGRAAAILIRKIWKYLKEGGQIVFGNFSPSNPTRKGMELVSKWHLLHRTADELVEICEESGVPYTSLEVESETLGINLFCKIMK
jgi:extracellular factor (EF) 3-hydroxypalmitic acid methyl ester biosynthesis protein